MSNATQDPTTTTADPTSTTSTTSTDHGTGTNAGTQTQQTTTETTTSSERSFTQAQLDDIVKDRLNRQRAQLQQEQDMAALKAKAEWQPVAEKAEAELKELKPQLETLQGRIKTYEERLIKQVKETIKDWPAEAKALIPADADADTQMAAVEKARPLVERLSGTGAHAPGNGRGPAPRNATEAQAATEEFLRSSGRYASI